jgi:hypothetical protein
MESLLNGLVHTVASIYAVMAVVPFLSFFLLWFILYAMRKDKKEATRRTMDVTSVLLVGSVSSMYYQLFHSTFGLFLIIFLMLVCYGLVGNVQYRTKGAIQHKRLLQVTLRIGFLALSAMYVVLLLIGMIQYYTEI